MELDDLKPVWQSLERELQTQRLITSKLLKDQSISRVEASLKPLLNWQIIKIIVGVFLAGMGAQFWIGHMSDMLRLVSGIIVHAYGIALIVDGIRIVIRLKEIDYSAAVITVQKSVAQLERSYQLSGWILGLPWWLLWIPVSLVILTFIGVDLSRVPAQNWLPINIVIGIIGMVLTIVFFRWAKRSSRPEVRARANRLDSDPSINKAKRLLADIERFEQTDSSNSI